ncbi:protein LYK5-like [Chenopodium quinoa]|nr:protein LYK5-like [Chenopodium quinoa]
MCRRKMAVDAIPPTSPHPKHSSPRHRNNHRKPPSNSGKSTPTPISSAASSDQSTTLNKPTSNFTSSSTSHSSRHSLSSLRNSLPENPHLYDISEIRSATNNFLAKTYSASRCWRCHLLGKDVLIFQRKVNHSHDLRPPSVRQKLSSICRSHHIAIVNLVGASISGNYVYLVYDFIEGANLSDLLHNKSNPGFTVLDSWMSRMQIASDLANGIDYIHNNNTGLDVKSVHNHIKSSSVIVTEPSFNAKLCHFGTAELCGEPTEEKELDDLGVSYKVEEILDEEESTSSSPKKLNRSNSIKFNGTTGYMSPEFQLTGVGTRKSDVYAFGVVLVELLSGEEPVKYTYNKATKEYIKLSAVESGRAVVEEGGVEREGRLRKWIDIRLKDSYPVEVAGKMTRLAVECLHEDPNKRPDMRRVAGKISKLYLESQVWYDKMKIPTDFTVSFAPR